jgi:hypothetical protein
MLAAGTSDAHPGDTGEPTEVERRDTVRRLTGLVAALVMATVVSASPASARVVRMQTTVTLNDRSEPTVKEALREGFDTCLRGPVAKGFSRVRVDAIQVLQDTVVLATVATDEDHDDEAPENARDQ